MALRTFSGDQVAGPTVGPVLLVLVLSVEGLAA